MHHSARETAGVILLLFLLLGAIGGFLLAGWIFRGGLSRYTFREDELFDENHS